MGKTVELAGCIITDNDSRVLLLHRRPYEDLPARWEIPGGKIKEGESADAAAIREAQEELHVRVAVIAKIGSTAFSFRGIEYSYDWFKVQVEGGEPEPSIGEPANHDDLAYVDLRSRGIGVIDLSPAAEKLAHAIQNEEVAL